VPERIYREARARSTPAGDGETETPVTEGVLSET
jgi:hypothetical protein